MQEQNITGAQRVEEEGRGSVCRTRMVETKSKTTRRRRRTAGLRTPSSLDCKGLSERVLKAGWNERIAATLE